MLDSTVKTPSRLSWSSVSTYSECGVKWLLQRGFRIPDGTWYATLAGSAIHSVTEAMDRAELKGIAPDQQIAMAPSFKSLFDKNIEEAKEQGIEIKASGRVLKTIGATGGPNKKDYDWWLIYGPIFVERWLQWKQAKGWRIATMPDGNPGIELKFQVVLNGVLVLGYIDRVYLLKDGSVVVVDLKTGTMPTGSLQLVTYAAGLREEYGVDADWGAYWTPGTDEGGKMSSPIYIKDWGLDRIARMYRDAEVGIRNGIFLPQVTAMCKGCGVRDSCWAVAGENAKNIPEPEMMDRTTGEFIPLANAATLADVAAQPQAKAA